MQFNLGYSGAKLQFETGAAFNQSDDRTAGTDYAPKGFTNYKLLVVGFVKYALSDKLSVNSTNSADAVQDNTDATKLFTRYTNGGRIEFTSGKLYITTAAYYQHGRNASDKEIQAFYVQPEIKVDKLGNFNVRLGAEWISGNDVQDKTDLTDRSFSTLYGSGHRFNGSMDLLTSFPAHVGNAGLFNPYLFVTWKINKQISLRSDFHSFSTLHPIKVEGIDQKRLGIENDWLLTWKPSSYIALEYGFSWAKAEKLFYTVKKQKYTDTLPYWSYIQLTISPELFKTQW